MAASQKERLTWEQLVLTIAEKKFAALGRDATTLAGESYWKILVLKWIHVVE